MKVDVMSKEDREWFKKLWDEFEKSRDNERSVYKEPRKLDWPMPFKPSHDTLTININIRVTN